MGIIRRARYDECRQCVELPAVITANNRYKRQVFEIENGGLAIVEHQLAAKLLSGLRRSFQGRFPTAMKAPVQYGTNVLSGALYLHLYQLLPNFSLVNTVSVPPCFKII